MISPIEEEVISIQQFVHAALNDAHVQEHLRAVPQEGIVQWVSSPRVGRVLSQLAPMLTGGHSFQEVPSTSWWGK